MSICARPSVMQLKCPQIDSTGGRKEIVGEMD